MNQGTLKTLGIATIALAAGTFALTKYRDSETKASTVDRPVAPALQDRVNDTAAVIIEAADGTVTLEREGADWTLAEKAGYPANAEKIRELILSLRDAKILEEKTANKDRFNEVVRGPVTEGGGRDPQPH